MNKIERNKKFLTDLFAGQFRGHAILMEPEGVEKPGVGDVLTSDKPLDEWVDWEMRQYESRLEYLDALDDDGVPFLRLWTGTQLFAAAFGCDVHVFEDTPPAARPLVRSAADADKLREPSLDHPIFERIFEYGRRLQQRAGADAIIGVPDIQSPFDIAALVWNKEEMYIATMDTPDAVMRLVGKCHRLLEAFLKEFLTQFPQPNLCHCPYAWAPPVLGCWLSEDEAGAMSVSMFDEFCMPSLVGLSDSFGGIFVHCCATADHQYGNFLKLPNLRAMNRVFQEPGPKPAVDAFAGRAVLMNAWFDDDTMMSFLDMAQPESRFLFNMPGRPLDEARETYKRMRKRCPRQD